MKLEKIKEIGPIKLIMLFVAGIILLFLSCKDFSGQTNTSENVKSERSETVQTEEEYRDNMEKQVVELLEQVEGVGKAQVMITLAASKEKVTLKDNDTSTDSNQEESVLVENEQSGSSPYILQEKEPVCEGVLVVCEGGGNAAVNREIIDAIQVLFHVEAHKIKVMKMDTSKGE